MVLHPDCGFDNAGAERNTEDMKEECRGWDPTYDHIGIYNLNICSSISSVVKLLGLVTSISHWRLMDHYPLETWLHGNGPVVLLGDACHPMLVCPVTRIL